MLREFECSILDINVDEIISKLESLGAIKVGEYIQRIYVYDFFKPEENRWVRLRTNDQVTTLTIKDKRDAKEIGSVKELEFVVEDFEKANEFCETIGLPLINYQEKKRISYELDGIEFDIDHWPLIPPYIEVEGKCKEEVLKGLDMLGLDKSKICLDTVDEIHLKYGFVLGDYKVVTFEGSEKK